MKNTPSIWWRWRKTASAKHDYLPLSSNLLIPTRQNNFSKFTIVSEHLEDIQIVGNSSNSEHLKHFLKFFRGVCWGTSKVFQILRLLFRKIFDIFMDFLTFYKRFKRFVNVAEDVWQFSISFSNVFYPFRIFMWINPRWQCYCRAKLYLCDLKII